jgi:hypothetical protein
MYLIACILRLADYGKNNECQRFQFLHLSFSFHAAMIPYGFNLCLAQFHQLIFFCLDMYIDMRFKNSFCFTENMKVCNHTYIFEIVSFDMPEPI